MSSSARFDELKKKFDENPRRYFAPLANEFRKSGDAGQAVMICEEFLPQQPGHMSGHIVYGQALYDLGRLDDARTVFETALTLDPENLIALRHLGDISRSHGDLESARQWYQRVLEADPRNEEVQALITSLDESAPAAAPASSAAPIEPQSFSPAPPAPTESFLELDVVEEHALGAAPGAAEPAAPPPTPPESEEPPFDAVSLEGLETSTPGSAMSGATGHAEGFEPMEFAAPAPGAGSVLGDQVEYGEFAAPPSSVAPLDGLEETAIGAFEARPEAAAPSPAPSSPEESVAESAAPESFPPPLPELEPFPETATDAAANEPPVDIPPEVIAAEAELMDAREATEVAEAPAAPATPPRVTPSQPFVTETMAELYVKQGFREQALDVYKLLLAASPENQHLRDRVAELQQREEVDTGPNVRAFFAQLAARRPGDQGASAIPPASDDFASFDSFETVPESTTAVPSATQPPASPGSAPEPTSASSAAPEAPEAPAPGDGSLDTLFGQRAVGQADASAASALAQAFGGGSEETPPISGRPARAAAGELSLDSVFKDGGARPPRSAQSFSFDQFFSESAAADAPAEPGPTATPSQGTGAQSQPAERSADDIEQFNSWLQGLKQR